MTFNIRYGTANDGENAWPKRRALAAEMIRSNAPDIVGTQECLKFQAEYLGEAVHGYAWIGRGREADGEGEMTAVLYNTNTLAAVESGHFSLSETPEALGVKSWDAALPRMATWVRFKIKATGKRIHFINTHFDHRGAQAREESAKLLARRVEELPKDLRVIVVGDFNAQAEDSAPWKALTAQGLEDAWRQAEKRIGPANTWNGFAKPEPENARRIDWILTRGGVQIKTCQTLDQDHEGRYPSDHFPVQSVLILR